MTNIDEDVLSNFTCRINLYGPTRKGKGAKIITIPDFTDYFKKNINQTYNIMEGYQEIIGTCENIIKKADLKSFIENGTNIVVIGGARKGKTRLLENLFNKDDIIDCKEIFYLNNFCREKALPIIFEQIIRAKPPIIIDDDTLLINHQMSEEYSKYFFHDINNKASQFVITFTHKDLFFKVREYMKGDLLVINLVGKYPLPNELI